MDFIGPKSTVSFFDNAITSGRLAHAYCLVGLAGMGKQTLARAIAGKLLNILPEKLDNHPDFFSLKREDDTKTGKLKKEIAVVQTRALIAALSGRAWHGGYRVAVVDEAEILSEASANALLKLLEEPGARTVFFLLATNEDDILPTVRSRCQMIYFSPLLADEIIAALIAAGYDRNEAVAAAAMSWGRPGRALRYLQDQTARENYEREIQRWQNLQQQPFYKKLAVSDDLFGDKVDHIRSRDRLSEVIDLWIMQLRQTLLHESAKDLENICAIVNDLQEVKNFLRQNIHPRLLLERVLLKF